MRYEAGISLFSKSVHLMLLCLQLINTPLPGSGVPEFQIRSPENNLPGLGQMCMCVNSGAHVCVCACKRERERGRV